jgi:threonine aldolase
MSNLIAALAHAADDRRMVALENSHLAWSIAGNARIGRLVNFSTVPSDARGLPDTDQLLATIRAPGALPVGLICFENTHNQAGGTALVPSESAPTRGIGVFHFISMARLFNAAVALSLEPGALTQEVDSVTFCISKRLGAPVGSLLCGSSAFIERARELRKWLGGTIRQAGIIAAAGPFALGHGIERLAKDHRNARLLAEHLVKIPGLRVSPNPVETNLIFVRHETIETSILNERLLARGVLTNQIDGRIR